MLSALVCFAGVTAAGAHPGLHHDIDRVTEALALEPGRADLLRERAFLLRLDGKPGLGLADLDRARTIEPGNRGIAAERGMALSALGRDREAEQELTRFLTTGPATAAVLTERARVRARIGRNEDAIADYDASIALQPEVPAYLARGALLESLGKTTEAHDGYLDGVTRLSGEPNLRRALLRLDVETRRFDEALALVAEEIARADVKTDGYLRRAEVLEAAGRKAEATKDRERALEEADRAIATSATGVRLVSRARAHLALGRSDEARRDLLLAVAKAPRYVEARRMLAELDGGGAAGGAP
jgi:tetratricopeptide (TPR) repeat protein